MESSGLARIAGGLARTRAGGPLALLAALAAASATAAAGAVLLEHLGIDGPGRAVAPSCPGLPCDAITDTTGFQAAVAGHHNAMVVARAGRVTSWSIALGAVTPAQVTFFTRVAHGPAAAELVVLRQGAAYRFRVLDASPLVALNPYFGKTSHFTLARPLAVAPGEVLALSVPTWAPAIAVGLDASTGWRSSRAHGACLNLFLPTAQTMTGGLAKYQCVYRTARLTYGATVTDAPRAAHR